MKRPCQHCGNRLAYCPGQLCRPCYDEPTVRVLYVDSPDWIPAHTLYPPLAQYPDPAARSRCRHGLLDGECPQCEREVRAEEDA